MTTEIAIMNRQGIALAADSAVTIGRERVWKTANKLFSLGPHNDIAVMTFGAGDFLTLPWETIIKTFRTQVGARKFETVERCAISLINYLRSERFKNDNAEKVSVILLFLEHLELLKKATEGYRSKKEFRERLLARLTKNLGDLENNRGLIIADVDFADFEARFERTFMSVVRDVFKEYITSKLKRSLLTFGYEIYRREVSSSYETGLVIAGFGSSQYFPSLVTYRVDGKCGQDLRTWIDESLTHDLNDPKVSEAVIIPFMLFGFPHTSPTG